MLGEKRTKGEFEVVMIMVCLVCKKVKDVTNCGLALDAWSTTIWRAGMCDLAAAQLNLA